MKTAIAISAMMRNVFSVAKIPPATVTASQMERITPRIVPMIRPMYLSMRLAPPGTRRIVPGRLGPAEPVRAVWHIWPSRP